MLQRLIALHDAVPMTTDVPADFDSPHLEKRRVALPLILLLATCASTFWTGAVSWKPIVHIDALYHGIAVFSENLPQGAPVAALWQAMAVAQMDWRQGLLYMTLVMGVLLAHEMGHFVMTVKHRIPASLPYFIPFPIVSFGTLGAVIGMEECRTSRRALFDMGAAGPLAGLIVALPVTVLGVLQLPAAPLPGDSLCFHNPTIIQWMIAWLRPTYATPGVIYLNQFNAFLMAGWVGILLTGFNMLPIGQLDGGHVAYALLGRRAHGLARGLLIGTILVIIVSGSYFWVVMIVLVTLMGTDHPPTAGGREPLGWWRTTIGTIALLVPVVCFPQLGITPVGQ